MTTRGWRQAVLSINQRVDPDLFCKSRQARMKPGSLAEFPVIFQKIPC
jgi:hypothetical protein